MNSATPILKSTGKERNVTMNKLRKLTCLLLALVMVFALAATASAADAYTITITNENDAAAFVA